MRWLSRVATRGAKLAGAVVLLFSAAGCAGSPGVTMQPHPSDAAARQVVQRMTELVAASDWDGLCALYPNCPDILDGQAKLAAPASPPLILGTADVPDSGNTQGGRAVYLCGLDGNGRAYRTDILIFGSDDDPVVITPVFWWAGWSSSMTAPGPTPVPNPACPGGTAG